MILNLRLWLCFLLFFSCGYLGWYLKSVRSQEAEKASLWRLVVVGVEHFGIVVIRMVAQIHGLAHAEHK